jgi:DNA-binding CsgD family transcriptional regulator/KaiC/GvpD/RAD55 family RecA-like ATPase
MVLGRAGEQAVLARLLDTARAGQSGAVVVRGEPGIGKTALLQDAVKQASDMTVLFASGVESESELAFSGLLALLQPILDLRSEIPQRQAAALASALAMGPPQPVDRLTISAATLSLLAAQAERNPVLVVIDDAHWLDLPSRDAVLFAARRLKADRVAIVFAARTGESATFDAPGIEEMALGGLDPQSCRELLAAEHSVAEPVAVRVANATAGNPLAILEIRRLLSAAQLAGHEAIDEPLPTGPRVQRSFERRVSLLPESTRHALLLAAASQSGLTAEVRRACTEVGVDFHALEAAEGTGLIRIEGTQIHFMHPLVRAAVYHGANPLSRRAAHSALAMAVDGADRTSQHAWHLAAATVGDDESVAASLESAALEARARGGYASAATTFERASRLTPDANRRARRLLEAAGDAHVAGESIRALALLQQALLLVTDAALRAEIQHMRGRVEMWTHSPAAARKILLEAADQLESSDPARAALVLVDAATTSHMEGDPAEGVLGPALRISRRAYELASKVGGPAAAAAAGLLGKTLIVTGEAGEGYPLLQECQATLDSTDSIWTRVQLIQVAIVFLWLEEYERARQSLERFIADARAANAFGALPYALCHLSEVDFRMGRWSAAYTGAFEGAELAAALGQDSAHIYGLACLAWVEAGLGDEINCRSHLDTAMKLFGPLGVTIFAYSLAIRGLLDLGLGRYTDALSELELLESLLAPEHALETSLFQSAPNLIEAYVHAGRLEDARRALAAFDENANLTKRNWALACAARCHGLIEVSDFASFFEHALELHSQTPTPFESARTELCYGERLRRARRRSDARNHLHPALETFERLGAKSWAARTRAELRATGENVGAPPVADSLTVQELQIALKVVEGATNREVAAALFLSPKTVEAHLSHIYSKLGLRSRTELARRFAEGSVPSPTAP